MQQKKSGFGRFNPTTGPKELAHVLLKAEPDVKEVTLLGCRVTPDFAQQFALELGGGIKVETLKPYPNSLLDIDASGFYQYGWAGTLICSGNISEGFPPERLVTYPINLNTSI